MKKSLLLLTLVAIACSSASAAGLLLKKDPNGYEKVNGIGMRNLWLLDRFHYGVNELQNDFEWCNTKARTAVMQDGVVYVARSEAKQFIVPGANGNDTIMGAVVYRFDAMTGEEMAPLDVTLNGEPYGVFLGANTIGKDNFGHVWVAPYTSEKTPDVPLYQLNIETGELTLVATLNKGDVIARTDYVDLIGDITLEQAECNVMTPGSQVPTVYAWHNDQGGDADTWEGFFSGDPYMDFTEMYPESQTQWGYAPASRFVLGEDEDMRYSGENFYIDGFTTVPTLYASDGTIVDGFGSLSQEEMQSDSLLVPEVGCNGIAEFKLGDRNFIVYPLHQYNAPGACEVNICELGEGMSFSGMQRYWTFPADGQGQTSDSGLRIHPITADYTEEGGKDAVLVFEYKCYNGMGVYVVGEGVTPDDPSPHSIPGDVNGDGNVTAADITALYDFMLNNDTSHIVHGDQTGDGIITAADITAVYSVLLGGE
ncbi:MAG: dockerin type I repeat-containing protein [Muribaculaceae bacterium]|nr:dockerin type I repeat-containing protein [Muribaculaceae bacterium]